MTVITRSTLLAALPHLPAVLPATVLLATAGSRLPDPIASHFGITGVADGFSGRGTIIGVHLGLGVLLTVLYAVGAHRGAGDRGRFLVTTAWALAGFLGVLLYVTAAVNLDLADAADAVLPGWSFPLAVAAGLLTGSVGSLLAPRVPPTTPASQPVRVLRVGATEQVSWSRTVRSRLVLLIGCALAVAGAGFAIATPSVGAWSLVAVGVVLAALFGSARVTVDRRGLRVSLGPFGWPRVEVPAADIASATAADVSPFADFGGWGYRIRPAGSGVVLRAGPALVVTRRSGRRFTVTVDDAGTAADLLNGVRQC